MNRTELINSRQTHSLNHNYKTSKDIEREKIASAVASFQANGGTIAQFGWGARGEDKTWNGESK